jgi:DNA-binding response OmpR family regulator
LSGDAKILVIEDDVDIAYVIWTLLAQAGLAMEVAYDGRQGLRLFHERHPDLIVLDVGLPVMDGWQVLDRIREVSDVGVLMLTARDLETDKVRGLQAGADDYLTKPFARNEFLARVQALLRRSRPSAGEGDVYDDGRVELDYAGRTVRVDGHLVTLTPIEFRLLLAFVRSRGRVLSPGQLLEQAWQDPVGIGPDRVKFAILRLRRKLGWTSAVSPIEAVRGFGYRYLPPASSPKLTA